MLNYFKPKNDIQNNYWFTLNDNDLFEYTGRKFSNFIIYETNNRLNFPNPKKITANISNLPNNIQKDNNHLPAG